MRRLKEQLKILLLLILIVSVASAAERSRIDRRFRADLSGMKEIPPVDTKATGKVDFELPKEADRLIYNLVITDIEDITGAQIHMGKPGESGPPVATLLSEPKEPAISGTLFSEGRIEAYELAGPLKGKPLRSLIEMIESGDAYVNVHTRKHPEGEIRGQITADKI